MKNAKLENSNDTIFANITLDEVCISCKLTENSAQCTHMVTSRAAVKTIEKLATTKALYAPLYEDVMQREVMGLQTRKRNLIFSSYSIDQFLASPRVTIDNPVQIIYLTVDPSGGTNDEVGVAAMCEYPTVERRNTLVVGLFFMFFFNEIGHHLFDELHINNVKVVHPPLETKMCDCCMQCPIRIGCIESMIANRGHQQF